MSAKVTHPYHLVNPSIWPLLTAFAIMLMVVGSAFALHKDPLGLPLSFAGTAAIIACVFFWWRDVIREGLHDHAHTEKVRTGLRMGMALFICSEVMFFVAFFWAYLARHGSPNCRWKMSGRLLKASGRPKGLPRSTHLICR